MRKIKCTNCWHMITKIKKNRIHTAGFTKKRIIVSVFCPHCGQQDLYALRWLEYRQKGIDIIEPPKPKIIQIVMKRGKNGKIKN